MTKILAIALNTFREAVRNRVLYVLLFFAVIVLVGAWIASTLSLGAEAKVVRDLGIGAVNVISVLMAVFVGVGLVYNDLDKKTIYTVVPKPIFRWQFIVGKYLGLLGTIVVNILLMTYFFCAVLYMRESLTDEVMTKAVYTNAQGVGYDPGRLAVTLYVVKSGLIALAKAAATVLSWGHLMADNPITIGLMDATLLTIFETMLVTAFALFFSTFSSPTLSAFLTVAVFLIGRLNSDLYDFSNGAWERAVRNAGDASLVPLGQKIAHVLGLGASYLSPNLTLFNQTEAITNMQALTITADVPLYAVVYTTLVLTISIMIFNRRNFK